MPNLLDMEDSEANRVMIYGAPKTGKTLLAGELAEHFNLIFVDMENGYLTLRQLPREWQKNITLIHLPDTRSFPIATETCRKMVKTTIAIDICDKHGKVSCGLCKKAAGATFVTFDPTKLTNKDIVIFDSATQLTSSTIAHITKAHDDDYKLQTDDWGDLSKLMDVFYSHVQQVNYNVIVISHETEANLEEKGKASLVPVSGSRNFSRNVAKFFDHIIYAKRSNRKHEFASSTLYQNKILTGSRTNVELETDDEATLLRIFKSEDYPDTTRPTVVNPMKKDATGNQVLKSLQLKGK